MIGIVETRGEIRCFVLSLTKRICRQSYLMKEKNVIYSALI